MEWHFVTDEILSGALGGLVYAVFRDEIFLPHVSKNKIHLGFIRALILGAFIGFIVDTHPVFSALMGFSFNDVFVAIQKRIGVWLHSGGVPVGGDETDAKKPV